MLPNFANAGRAGTEGRAEPRAEPSSEGAPFLPEGEIEDGISMEFLQFFTRWMEFLQEDQSQNFLGKKKKKL